MASGRILALIAVLLQRPAIAQPAPSGRMALQVFDASGAYIPAAAVTLESIPSATKTSFTTDGHGRAGIDLAPGAYRISVGSYGFTTSTRDLEVKPGGNQRLEITLQAAPTPCDPCGLIVDKTAQVPLDLAALAPASLPETAFESALTIRTAHNSEPELATKAQLERLIAAYDLRQWTFTHEVVIDEKSIPHSHPVLTLHTRHLKQDDELLSTYLHEQLHWFLTRHPEETKAAEQDLMELYPNVPVGYPEGANDTESTYLHLLVCRLEQQADNAVIGQQRTADAMQFWAGDHYRWVYRTVRADGAKIDEILTRHRLTQPDARIVTRP